MEKTQQQNRFGMFIHWGLYAIPAVHEQVLARGGWSHADYEALAAQFNPTEYDPEEWVLLAKEAGMSYICITTKHHDGFCMWDTKQTDYNIMHTPYGRDVLAMLADACRKHGMKLSLYYSIPDWHHPNAYNPKSSHQDRAKDPASSDMDAYIAFIKAQVTELLTGYGEIYTFFWDIPPCIEDRSVNALLRSLQPGIIINNRGFDEGDFATPEREVPEGDRFPAMTEACQSVGEQSWGYRAEEDYFSAQHLMMSIDKTMAMGGSYLLNVGPTAEGRIPEASQALLRRIGRWYRRVENTLVNTAPAERRYSLSCNPPYIAAARDGWTYLHFYEGLNSTAVTFLDEDVLPPVRAILCNSGEELRVRYGTLPSRLDADGVARKPYLSVTGIPVDDYPAEPIVIALRFGNT